MGAQLYSLFGEPDRTKDWKRPSAAISDGSLQTAVSSLIMMLLIFGYLPHPDQDASQL